jgi:hypothetical protein
MAKNSKYSWKYCGFFPQGVGNTEFKAVRYQLYFCFDRVSPGYEKLV